MYVSTHKFYLEQVSSKASKDSGENYKKALGFARGSF